MASTITRSTPTDDDGSGQTGTPWDAAYLNSAIYDKIDLLISGAAAFFFGGALGVGRYTSVATGAQNDWDLEAANGGTTVGILRCNNASLLTINGLVAGGEGQLLWLYSVGAGQVDIANENTGSAAANRVMNGVTGTISLAAGVGRALLVYDGTQARWRVLHHEQGAFITRTFAAGNYTASGSMTWTVAAGDVLTDAYYLKGRQLTYIGFVTTSTVGGTPSTTLKIAIPGGFTAAKRARGSAVWINDNGTPTSGFLDIAAVAATVIDAWRTDAGNFAASTDNTTVAGELVFEVQ